ncbi:MAG: glycosyltransferase family 4 protein [Bacteroides sp.]|nr:glycosyltransferase family 4 protein [Bacteroides sp.]
MNIIHLVRATTWGGGERYAYDLVRASVQAGHDVIVVTKGSPAVDGKMAECGARLVRMPLGGVFDFVSPLRLAGMIRKMDGDEAVVHVHTFKDAEIAARAKTLVGKSKRVRIVCTRHLVKMGKRSPRWSYIFRQTDALIFVSELAEREFLKGSPDVSPEKIRVIPNSIVPPKIEPRAASHADNPGNAGATILFTGRLSEEKGIEDLITALSLLDNLDFRVRIAGTGKTDYVDGLHRLTESCGVADRVDWLGFTSDVFAEIGQADICVAPSVARESFGLTLLEFMSQGRPVIATDSGAQPEIITDRSDGFLIPPHRPDRLAETIRELTENPELRKRIGDNARRTFSERFSFERFFERITRVYEGF